MCKIISILLLLTSIYSSGQTNLKHKKQPSDLKESLLYLDMIVDDSIKHEIQKLPVDLGSIQLHLIYGILIRDKWGLWQDSKLKQYFLNKGVYHPYYMSDIIFTSYCRNINNLPINEQVQIQNYRSAIGETWIPRTNCVYTPDDFISLSKDMTDSFISLNFKEGDTIFISEFNRLSNKTPTKRITISTALVIDIKNKSLVVQVLNAKRKPKLKMSAGYVYDIERKKGDIYTENIENCGLHLPKLLSANRIKF